MPTHYDATRTSLVDPIRLGPPIKRLGLSHTTMVQLTTQGPPFRTPRHVPSISRETVRPLTREIRSRRIVGRRPHAQGVKDMLFHVFMERCAGKCQNDVRKGDVMLVIVLPTFSKFR